MTAKTISLAWRTRPRLVVLAVLIAAALAAVPVAVAWSTKLILDSIVASHSTAAVLGLSLFLAALGLLSKGLEQGSRYCQSELDRSIALAAQSRLYTAVNRLPGLARFENPAFLDRLRLAQTMGGRTPSQILTGALSIGAAVVGILGFTGSLLALNPVLAAVLLIGAIPALLAELSVSRCRVATYLKLGPVERRELFYSQLMADPQAAKEIRLFGIGAFLHGRMIDDRETANAANRKLDVRELRVQSALGVLAALIAGGGLVWTILRASQGTLMVGDISMFVAAVGGVQNQLAGLVGQVARTHQQLLLFRSYLEVENAESDLVIAASPRPVPPLTHGIKLEDVWFRYNDEHPWVLRGATLEIRADACTGLVGLNGAGKSTIVKLLCRMYDPTRGRITWDGIDLRDFDPAELRCRIGATFQDFMQYDLSARENIGIGALELLADDSAVEAAARNAGIHKAIESLPKGYDTLLTRIFVDSGRNGDESIGVFLSGGQWQRIALARALLRGDRDFLILDEPSSGLDAEAEHEVHTRISDLRLGRTSLLISHRLGAIRHADTLAVLDDGVFAETGGHDELIRAGGIYARLFRLQASGYRDETNVSAAGV
ncbi:ABC transporter ATP-binding protein [Microbispora hainanensis]|nr:ABC transporter ATP-binding protein [Microbispora hainanensis]